MNVFFISQAPPPGKDSAELSCILRLLQQQRKNKNISISYQLYNKGETADDSCTITEHVRLVDAVIADITYPQFPVYGVLAFAIMFSKPLQCLYQCKSPPTELLALLAKQDAQSPLKISPYSKTNVSKILQHFIWNIAHPHVRTLQSLPPRRFHLPQHAASLTKELERVTKLYKEWV